MWWLAPSRSAVRLKCKPLFVTCLATMLMFAHPGVQAVAAALDDVRAGNELFKAGRLDDAIDAYTNAVTSGELEADTLAITYNNRGVALGEQGEFDRAIEDYEKALQLLPEDPTTAKNLRVAFIKRGLLSQEAGDLEAALLDLDAAIAAEPDNHLGYLRRAELNVARGNLALAVSDYKLALARNPGDADLISALNQAREALTKPLDTQVATDETPIDGEETQSEAPQAVVDPLPSAPQQPLPVATPPAESVPTNPQAEASISEPTTIPDVEPAAGGDFVRTIGAVNVRDAAANSGALVTTVAEGVVLPLLGVELGWMRVQLSDGRIGYIYQRWVETAQAE